MDWNIRKNLKYLLLLLGLCAVIPHGALCLLQIASASEHWSPAEIEAYSKFFVCEWTPFWAAFIAYWRLQKKDRFSLLPAAAFGLILLSFLPRFPRASVSVLALTVPMMLVMESSALLKTFEMSQNKVLSGIAADRWLLRAFFFWSLEFLCLIFICCEARTDYITVVSPFQMLPFPGILLFDVFRHQKNRPPTIWSVMGMLVTIPVSLFLVTTGPMERFKLYHLACLVVGYGILFLMLIVYNLDRWKMPKAQTE